MNTDKHNMNFVPKCNVALARGKVICLINVG